MFFSQSVLSTLIIVFYWLQVSQDELRSAYRRLCMIYHPDKHDESNHKQASDIFAKIQAAYVGRLIIFLCLNSLLYYFALHFISNNPSAPYRSTPINCTVSQGGTK